MKHGEPIKDGAPLVYTERKDGVRPEFDPRTDRFELAVDAMDKVTRDKLAKREARMKGPEAPEMPAPGPGPESPNKD